MDSGSGPCYRAIATGDARFDEKRAMLARAQLRIAVERAVAEPVGSPAPRDVQVERPAKAGG